MTSKLFVPSSGSGLAPLTDPGNAWEPDTAVTQGYRIAETIQGELRVFEAVEAGTTNAGATAFTDFTVDLTPLGITEDLIDWRYLGIVGELPWTVAPRQAAFGQDAEGPYVAGTQPISQAETTFRILAALGDPGNAWEAATAVEAAYRISVTVDGALRVFQASPGTTGATEPAWNIAAIGDTTTDGTASWSYQGIVGGPDRERLIFVANSAGDADWVLDINNGSGFRFNLAEDGVLVSGSGMAQFTTDGFKVYTPTESFEVRFDPFSIDMVGLPTANPNVAGRLWVDSGTLKVSAG